MDDPLILLVEDDIGIQQVMKAVLEGEHYRVAVSDGPAALEDASRLQPDVILLDLYMPRVDGEEVYRHLEAEPATKDIPVVLTSAVYNLGAVAKRLKAESYLLKPYTLQLLKDKIGPLIEAHRAHRTEHTPPP